MIDFIDFDLINLEHVKWLFEVRTHPKVAINFFAPPPASFEEHVKFLNAVIPSKKRIFFIVYLGERMAGYCQLIFRQLSIEVGFAVHPDMHGQGIGSASVLFVIKHIHDHYPERIENITLVVKESNLIAVNLYTKHGFVVQSRDEVLKELTMKFSPLKVNLLKSLALWES